MPDEDGLWVVDQVRRLALSKGAACRRSQSPHTGTDTPARMPRTRASTRSSRSRSIHSTCAGPSPRWLGVDAAHGECSPHERQCLLQLPHRVRRPVAAPDLRATGGARQRLVARAPGSASSDRRCPLPFAWTHQHDATLVSAKATSCRLGGRGRPPPFFSRSVSALASWTLTFPCSDKGDAPQVRVTRLGAGSVCGMQKR